MSGLSHGPYTHITDVIQFLKEILDLIFDRKICLCQVNVQVLTALWSTGFNGTYIRVHELSRRGATRTITEFLKVLNISFGHWYYFS